MRVKRCPRGYVDIYRNPDNPGNSRIPIDTCMFNIDRFLCNEIELAKNCGCPSCDFRRNMLRRIQEIMNEYRLLKANDKNKPRCINNH